MRLFNLSGKILRQAPAENKKREEKISAREEKRDKEKPLARDDLFKLIEEHGGPKGVDLSWKNLKGIKLPPREENEPPYDLHGIILIRANLQNTELADTDLQDANLASANLQHAYLSGINLQRANLANANLRGTDLRMANLQNARLWKADLRRVNLWDANLEGAMLEDVTWDHKYIDRNEKAKFFGQAEQVYRNLKRRHNEQGLYNLAGKFYFREMTVRRKSLKWWPNPLPRATSKFLAVLCGYGEKPERVVISAAAVVLGLAGIYTASALTFLDSLYHSAVSFTALGYGLGVSTPEGWVKALGAAESFMGVFMMALFLITFVRKMTR